MPALAANSCVIANEALRFRPLRAVNEQADSFAVSSPMLRYRRVLLKRRHAAHVGQPTLGFCAFQYHMREVKWVFLHPPSLPLDVEHRDLCPIKLGLQLRHIQRCAQSASRVAAADARKDVHSDHLLDIATALTQLRGAPFATSPVAQGPTTCLPSSFAGMLPCPQGLALQPARQFWAWQCQERPRGRKSAAI